MKNLVGFAILPKTLSRAALLLTRRSGELNKRIQKKSLDEAGRDRDFLRENELIVVNNL